MMGKWISFTPGFEEGWKDESVEHMKSFFRNLDVRDGFLDEIETVHITYKDGSYTVFNQLKSN